MFYDEGDRERARPVASRLEEALASPEYAGSIRGEEIRSLVAELCGDFAEAARCREAEIRKILELHALTVNTPAWKSVCRQYDFSDVSDRLDLLAMLYDALGDLDRAIATQLESKEYCESHDIPFDAQDLLEELQNARRSETGQPRDSAVSTALLDETIREVYREFESAADDIVVSDEESRRFSEAVHRRLPEHVAVPVENIRRRLLTLRRRGAARGGLPRRKH